MDETGDRRRWWVGVWAQPGALVVFGCASGVVLLWVLLVVLVLVVGAVRGGVVVEEEGVLLGSEPTIRVRIVRGAAGVVIGGPRVVEVVSGDVETGRGSVLVSTPMEVRWVGGAMVGVDGEGIEHAWGDREVRFSGVSGADSEGFEPVRVDGRGYPGGIRLVARADGFDVVNDVLIDAYLPGVIVKELYGHWDEVAFRVQAICARGYALHVVGQVGAGRHYDINAGESAQTYVGVTEHVKAIEAVRATRGLALVFDGEVIRSYYSSTCGGRSGSASDVWGVRGRNVFNGVAPLAAHDRAFTCEEAPLFRWTRVRDVGALSARLAAFGAGRGRAIGGLGRLSRIEIVRQAVTGRPARYAVHDVEGAVYEISAEDLRLACNTLAPGLGRPGEKERVMSNDLVFMVHGDEVEIAGRGFGHGVGMCQYGANAMAGRGVSVRTMLGLFFPGAEIERQFE